MPPKKNKGSSKKESGSPATQPAPSAGPSSGVHPRALILVGGYGTRLRPFTFTVPKPLVPFINKPIVQHQIEALVKVGVKEIILAVNVQPQQMLDFLKVMEAKFGIKIVCSQEDVPLGTAGPLALAKKLLQADSAPFFMFNSDVICEYPLEDMLRFHQESKAEGTILVTKVADPSRFGVVIFKANGQVDSFVEKPQVFVSDKINAGIYLFNPQICDRVELRPTSIEREIFPQMATEGKLFSMVLPGYWMDIGQPVDFLVGQTLHLDSMRKGIAAGELASSTSGYTILGNCVIDPEAKIGAGAVVGPHCVVAAGVSIGAGARVKRSCVLGDVKIGAHAFVNNCIVGWQSVIGDWSRVEASYLGEDVNVKAEVACSDITVCPHKGVGENTANRIIL